MKIIESSLSVKNSVKILEKFKEHSTADYQAYSFHYHYITTIINSIMSNTIKRHFAKPDRRLGDQYSCCAHQWGVPHVRVGNRPLELLHTRTIFLSMVRTRCTIPRVCAAKDCEFLLLSCIHFIWSGLIIIIIIIVFL